MTELIHDFINIIVNFIGHIGYVGIFIGMFLESTIIPIPSEVIMIPAGIASAKGDFDIYLVTIIGTIGNVLGAVFSYYLAKILGRKILLKIGRYFFIKPHTITQIEIFFKKHGSVSVFIGRLLPGFRHFISLPAGIANMNFNLFLLYTSLGSAIWTSILAFCGYFIGDNQDLILKYVKEITILVLILVVSSICIKYSIKKILLLQKK
jgi:membrane protein DedA with SNARE-associated domain